MRGKWILFAGITILLAIAGGALSVYRRNVVRQPAPVPVQAPAPALSKDVSLQGIVQAQRVVSVPAPIEGTIEQFGAEIGDDVFEGQLLAHIQNTRSEAAVQGATEELERSQKRVNDLDAAMVAQRLEVSRARADASRAKTDFDRAEKAYQRQQMLYREGATPRLVFEKSESEYKAAKQDTETKDKLAQQSEERMDSMNRELDSARQTLAERTQALDEAKADVAAGDVRAPVDGIVLSRRGSPGEQVSPTMEDFFRIAVSLSALEVWLQPEPAAVARIQVGQPAEIHVAEVPQEIAGKVREIKDGRVIVDFTSPTPALKPGVTAQVRIKLS